MTDDRVADALRAYQRARLTAERRRSELANAIGEAVVDRGVRQADIARQTGYTREHVRRLCNDYVERKAKAESVQPPTQVTN